jgi:hypothetical protein
MRALALSALLNAAMMRNRSIISQWADPDAARAAFWSRFLLEDRGKGSEVSIVSRPFLFTAVLVSSVSELLVRSLYAGWWQ